MIQKKSWIDSYLKKNRTPTEAIQLIQRAQRVFIGTSCGEPQALVRELVRQSSNFIDVEIVRVMSLDSTPITMIAHQSACRAFNLRSFYLGSAKNKYLANNKRFITPINLSAVPRLFKNRQLPINIALIQTSPPDDFGWVSLGISVDVTLAAAQNADLVIAQVNPKMPRILGQSFIHVNDIDIFVKYEEDLLSITEQLETDEACQIARHVAKLIDDGSTIQISLSATPKAIMLALKDKNDLGLHTQFLNDALMNLIIEGVITNRYKTINKGKSIASGAVGNKQLYDFLHNNPGIEFYPSDYVNDPRVISHHNKMVSLSVVGTMIDLTGQVICDAMPFNFFAGVTGVMDFIRGTAASSEGKSIIMIPSRTIDKKVSRITSHLNDNLSVVVPRGEIQYVVSEYGIVNLFGKNLQERALALISIAHPTFREQLFYDAKELGLIGKERIISDAIHGIYPLHLEEERFYDKIRVLFRPAKPVDERLIQEHFYGLTKTDIITRFFYKKKSFLHEEIAKFYQIDYISDLTIVAVIGEPGYEKIIAVGCYCLDQAKNLGEVAYSVTKEWQNKGIASVIQTKLVSTAREAGISGLIAYISPNNISMIRLFKKIPYKINSSIEEDLIILVTKFEKNKIIKEEKS